MRILVTAASRHGATSEIADAIAAALSEDGLEVEEKVPEEVETLEGYDAVVLGSAVYMGRWLKGARKLVQREGEALGRRPVWLFSSGPTGDAEPEEASAGPGAHRIAEALHAREHRVFGGKIDPPRLGFAERAILRRVHAESGDFRDLEAVRAWAHHISAELRPQS